MMPPRSGSQTHRGDLHYDQGVPHIRFREKREKIFSVMLHPNVQSSLFAYMAEAGHRDDLDAPLFLAMLGRAFTRRAISTREIHEIIVGY